MNDMFLYYLIIFSFVILAVILGIGVALFTEKIIESKRSK